MRIWTIAQNAVYVSVLSALMLMVGATGCAEQGNVPGASPEVSSCGNRISLGITTSCRNETNEVAGVAETWTSLGFEYSCPHSRCSEPRQITFHRDGTYDSREFGKGDLSLQDERDFNSAMGRVVEAGLVLDAKCAPKENVELDTSSRRLVLFVQSKAAADIYWFEPETLRECHLGESGTKVAISHLIEVLDRLAAKYD